MREEKVFINIQTDVALDTRLRVAAAEERKSKSELIRTALLEYLRKREEKCVSISQQKKRLMIR